MLGSSRERELLKKLEHQHIRMAHMSQELESTKEAQRIVLDTKESVMRSLLKQNSQITQEASCLYAIYLTQSSDKLFLRIMQRDMLAKRVEDLAATVEQLTGLLRNIQNRKQQKTDTTGSGSDRSSPSGPPMRRFSNFDQQFSIHGGGGGAAGVQKK